MTAGDRIPVEPVETPPGVVLDLAAARQARAGRRAGVVAPAPAVARPGPVEVPSLLAAELSRQALPPALTERQRAVLRRSLRLRRRPLVHLARL